MPIIPGRPIGRLFAERWLAPGWVIRSPMKGGGWATVVASASCRRGDATPVAVAQPGGLVTKQHSTIWVRRADAAGIRRGWDLIDPAGDHWVVDGVSDEPEAPTIDVDATRVD